MTAPLIVDDASGLAALCRRIETSERIGIDTEFHAERSYAPRLMVVQCAFDDGVAIVDPLALPDLRSLAQAVARTTVVGHALSSDLKIFAERFGVVPVHVFDTQVAAAFLGFGLQISLADLVRELQGIRLAKSQTVSDWSSRPFSARQLEYLVDDVVHLLPMRDELAERLRAAGRNEWAMEECAELGDLARYQFDERRAYMRIPGATRMSRRELAVLNELVKLRDSAARDRDVPPKYILPDDVVGGLATLRPKRVEELGQLRRLDGGARRQFGDAIVRAVARAEALDESNLPERPKRPLGPSRDTLASLMAVAVGEIARRHDLPANLLVPRNVLERIAREVPPDREALERSLDLRPWRLSLLVDPLWRLMTGEASLAVEGYVEGNPKVRFTHESSSG